MFGIDFSEILVIFAVALVVLGPQRLPKLAATIGRWLGRARAMARQFREQLEQEASRIQDNVDINAPRGAAGHPYPGPSSAQPPGSPAASPVSPEHTGPAAAPTQAPAEPTEQRADGAAHAGTSIPERAYTIADAGMPEPSGHSTVDTPPQPVGEVHAGLAGATAAGSDAHSIPEQTQKQPVTVEADERGG